MKKKKKLIPFTPCRRFKTLLNTFDCKGRNKAEKQAEKFWKWTTQRTHQCRTSVYVLRNIFNFAKITRNLLMIAYELRDFPKYF